MGNLFSRESTTESFEKALDAFDAKIRKEHVRLASLKPRRAAANRSATLYALAFWGVLVSIAFNTDLHSRIAIDIHDASSTVTTADDNDIVVVDGADRWKTDALRFLAVAIGPIILIFIRRFIAWWFERSQESSEASLESLRAKQRAKIEELKSITAFYRAKELIERYEHLLVDPTAQQQGNLPPHLQQHQIHQQKQGRSRHHTHDPRLQNPTSPTAASGGALPGPLNIDPKTRQLSAPNPTTSDPASATSPLALEAPPPTAVDPTGPAGPPTSSSDPAESNSSSSGWFSKIVERVVVGGDELEANQKYALICGMCHHHNGLAWPSEFPTLRFICRHCATLNDRGALAAGGPWLFQKIVPDATPAIEAPPPPHVPHAPFPPEHVVPPAINVMPPTPEAANVPLPPSPYVRPASVGPVEAMPGIGDVPPLPAVPESLTHQQQACVADEPVPVPVADSAVHSSGPGAGDASGMSLLSSPVQSAHSPPLSSGSDEDGGWERVDSPASVESLANADPRTCADDARRLDQVVSPSMSTSSPPAPIQTEQMVASLQSRREGDKSLSPVRSRTASVSGERPPSPKVKVD